MRWGLGPVFLYECLTSARRWQTYAVRSVGVTVLLGAIATIAMPRGAFVQERGWREYAALGESYFYAIIDVELTLVMLAAPASMAGAICVDRARGTLTHMLATDLSDPEIVLGKLAARMLPVLGLVACSWPVLAIASLLGGIDPSALTLAFAIVLAVAGLGCSLAMALSVWARKPHEVVLVVYVFWMLVLLLWPIWYVLSRRGTVSPPPHWSLVADPYYLAFAPYSAPGRVDFWEYAGFFAAALGASAALVVLAVRRMRPVAQRGTDEHRREPRPGLIGRMLRRLPGPSLDGNPVLWREWHRSRPSRWLLLLVVLVGGSTGLACAVGAGSAWAYGLDDAMPSARQAVGVFGAVLQLIFGLLMLSAVAPMAMSEERQRGSLDLLAATTLSTPTIVLGKWLGTFRLVPLLAIGPGLLGFALATAVKAPRVVFPAGLPSWYFEELSRGERLFGAGLLVMTILVHGALIASVGLALAVWSARQGRAIAASVGFAVIVSAGWPILISVGNRGPAAPGLSGVSPIVAVFELVNLLTDRFRLYRNHLWWITFWDVECLLLALGLLWLSVRTFDRCFGRIPERPGRAPVLADVVVVLAGLIGAGGLFGAIAFWIKGTWDLRAGADLPVLACIVLVTAGIVLVSALASSSMPREGPARVATLEPAAAMSGRKWFVIRWWESFRLVLLLAIGPALLALAMATAPVPIQVVTKATPLPGGGITRIETAPDGDIYVITTDAAGRQTDRNATAEEIAAAERVLGNRDRAGLLVLAAVTVLTILVHGAAFVCLGAALGVWIRRRGKAIAASVGLGLFITVGWPILALLGFGLSGLTLPSMIAACCGLLVRMIHQDPLAVEFIRFAGYWDAIVILSAVLVSSLAIRTLDRRGPVYAPPIPFDRASCS